MRAWRDDYLKDGLVIARGFLDESTLGGMQRDMEDVVESYARRLLTSEEHRRVRRLGFKQGYTALYQANLNSAKNRGLRSDLPSFFRSESHTSGMHKFLTHSRLHELIRCLLPHETSSPPALKLYPVYMARGKVPDAISKSAMTVDWHQDAAYTYYWYSRLNTTRAAIDEYAGSVVNTWVPITDTPLELGPVQLIRRRPPTLTRADFMCEGNCDADGIAHTANVVAHGQGSPTSGREYLRVGDIDGYIEAFPERVLTAEMRRGDVLFFDQYTYHRGLPNVSPNTTRWSVDFRFQDARVPTLRADPGFVLGSDQSANDAAAEFGAPLITTDEDWMTAQPSLRLSEVRLRQAPTESASAEPKGNRFASQHLEVDNLIGALELEQKRESLAILNRHGRAS